MSRIAIDAHGCLEMGSVDQTTHNAIVVANEQETQACQEGDRVKEAIAFQLHHLDSPNKVPGGDNEVFRVLEMLSQVRETLTTSSGSSKARL